MTEKNILRQANRNTRPQSNIDGDFECQQCRQLVSEAHYDAQKQILIWWCKDDHQSVIEEFRL